MTNTDAVKASNVQREISQSVSEWHRPAAEPFSGEWAWTESFVVCRRTEGTIVAYERPVGVEVRDVRLFAPRTGRRYCTIRG